MVRKHPLPSTSSTAAEKKPPQAVTVSRKTGNKTDTGTVLAAGLIVVASVAGWLGWQYWQNGEQFPAPVVRDGVVVFDGFGEKPADGGLPREVRATLNESNTQVTVVEEATQVTNSQEILPTSSTIVALPVSPTEGVVAAGDVLGPVTPVVIQQFSPRAELASQLGLLISAAKANLASTPDLAKALIPWAEQAQDDGLVALLTPLASHPVKVEEEAHQGPAWLQRWVVVKKKTVQGYAPDAAVLEKLVKYYIEHYVAPAKAPAAL